MGHTWQSNSVRIVVGMGEQILGWVRQPMVCGIERGAVSVRVSTRCGSRRHHLGISMLGRPLPMTGLAQGMARFENPEDALRRGLAAAQSYMYSVRSEARRW